MGTMMSKWHPSWWKEEVHGSAWERTKEAVRRDWMQTKHDLHVGGHEMNQTVKDTVKQAAGKENIPNINKANPPRVIGEWSDAEVPYGYGYGARKQFGVQHPLWNEGLEKMLEAEWNQAADRVHYDWITVRSFVRRGYEYGGSENQSVLGTRTNTESMNETSRR